VSPTATETIPSGAARSSSTRPPSGVHRNAFESKFVMICSTRSPSVTIVGLASKFLSYSMRRRRASSPNAAIGLVAEAAHVDLLLQRP
jgi:hypothetical protein